MNNYTYGSSVEAHGADIDLFSSKPVNSGVLSREYVIYRPKSKITEGAPIDVDVRTGMRYADLSKSKLCVDLQIVNEDGSPIVAGEFIKFYFAQSDKVENDNTVSKRSKRETATSTPADTSETAATDHSTPKTDTQSQDADSDVTLIQAILYTMWRQIDIVLQQKCVTSGVNIHNAYKSMIDIILDSSQDAKSSFLMSAGYYKDERNVQSSSLFSSVLNVGLIARNKLTSGGRIASFEGFLMSDICQQERCIINGVDIQIKLYPNTNAFCLLTGKDGIRYKIIIHDVYIKMCMVNLNPAVLVAQSEVIQSTPALYPYIESQLKSYNVPDGSYSISLEDMFQSWVPSELIICMVESKAYSGDYKTNPMYFKHLNVNYISLTVDGKSIPGSALQPNFEKKSYHQCYSTLFSNNKLNNTTNGITYDEYANGYTIIVFRISQRESNELVNLKTKGLVRLDIRFADALTEANTIIVYGKFPSIIQIDSSRNVIF